MELTRRDLLGLLAASPLAAGGCCVRGYPHSEVHLTAADLAVRPILEPDERKEHLLPGPVIDVHAHFFNASDIPVRGFLVECIGHTQKEEVQKLLKYVGWMADGLAALAPSAKLEVTWIEGLIQLTSGLSLDAAKAAAQDYIAGERQATADRLARAIRGKRFELEYRRRKKSAGERSNDRTPVSAEDILRVVSESEAPSIVPAVAGATARTQRADFELDGVLRFLYHFSSFRVLNIHSYIRAFCRPRESFGVDMVLGSLVDFDYWLDCPPRSSHDDQIRLMELLVRLHGKFLRPVVAYNPMTDIKQNNAGLKRVLEAHKRGFVAAKIYPPVGFMPAGNTDSALEGKLETFFSTCATEGIPILAHAEHTNGRDKAHDEFSSPEAWDKLLSKASIQLKYPVIDFGHFGGGGADKTTYWTKEFADLMGQHSGAPLYGDLGYWVDFMDKTNSKYEEAKTRLDYALRTRLGAQTGADRVMFGTDWLMLSQIDRWADYPKRVYDALYEVTGGDQVALGKIFGGNAKQCFNLQPRP